MSPHLDDAVYSCGGLIRDRVDAGDGVAVWTVFAGDPPAGPLPAFAESLHARWGLGREAAVRRREEDREACGLVGADFRHFDHPDCIYRRHPVTGEALYQSEAAIFGEPAAVELEGVVPALGREWERILPPGARVVCPLGLGGHVDHRLVRAAAERLMWELWYYADVPYVFKRAAEIPGRLLKGVEEMRFPVSETGFEAWMGANALYLSQFSSFWGRFEEMEAACADYLGGGLRLWRAVQPEGRPEDGEPLPGVEPGSRT